MKMIDRLSQQLTELLLKFDLFIFSGQWNWNENENRKASAKWKSSTCADFSHLLVQPTKRWTNDW